MEKRYELLYGRSRSDGGCLRIKSHRSWLRGDFLDVNSDHVNEIKENGFRLSGIGKKSS